MQFISVWWCLVVQTFGMIHSRQKPIDLSVPFARLLIKAIRLIIYWDPCPDWLPATPEEGGVVADRCWANSGSRLPSLSPSGTPILARPQQIAARESELTCVAKDANAN